MKPLQAALDVEVDLLIEKDRHSLTMKGSGSRYVATFPALSSLWYFTRVFWRHRKSVPIDASVQVQWWRLSIPLTLRRPR